MLPWDFGLINAFQKHLNCKIYPSEKPNLKPPYIVLSIDKFSNKNTFFSLITFQIKIVDPSEFQDNRFEIAKQINRLIVHKLPLVQNNADLGFAQIKINSLESKENSLILNLVGKLYLKQIYEDMENAI